MGHRWMSLAGMLLVGLLVNGQAGRAADAYQVKTVEAKAPKECSAAVAKLLDKQCLQFRDGKGTLLCELWFRTQVPTKAGSIKGKDAVKYSELPDTVIMGVVRVAKQMRDYRKQKIPPGVYTMRFGKQPRDGDHMGTAIYSTFVLLTPVADDKKAGLMEVEALNEVSAKTTRGHPAVWMLFPGGKDAGAKASVKDKGRGHWVVYVQLKAKDNSKTAPLPLGLTLLGTSPLA